jgi:hypothetical protein
MAKTMNISVVVDFTGDVWEASAQTAALKPIYDQFVAALDTAGVHYTASIDPGTTRAKRTPAAPANGKPRGRPRKQTGVVTAAPAPNSETTTDDLEAA